MKLVIFGLTISSSWGNGHATLWRGLCRAFAARGHQVVFFERDVPYYAAHRDLTALEDAQLRLYSSWADVWRTAHDELRDADAAMVTSYCPDAVAASDLLRTTGVPRSVFYDLDTPVTLDRIRSRLPVSYLGTRGLRDFDLVLSYTGGRALGELQAALGARRVAPLYGSVDPAAHRPAPASSQFRSDLSYLGTFAEDRQAALERLFVEPARCFPERRFLIGGPNYPGTFPWQHNIFYISHVPPPDHSAFYSSSRLTLNVTRRAMAEMGYCPSGRLFEAAACETPVVSDSWDGLNNFFEPGAEIVVASSSSEVVDAIRNPDDLRRIGRAARERVMSTHTAEHRSRELVALLEATA